MFVDSRYTSFISVEFALLFVDPSCEVEVELCVVIIIIIIAPIIQKPTRATKNKIFMKDIIDSIYTLSLKK